jgi:hypothetical protein
MPSKAMQLLAFGTTGGVVAMLACSLIFGSTQPIAPNDSGNDRLLASIEGVAQAVESLDRRLRQEHRNAAFAPGGPDRAMVSHDSMSGLIDRLEHAITLLHESRGGVDINGLATARRQNPRPNLPAVRALRQLLNEAPQERRLLAQQGWLLLTMEEVVRQLGSPSNVLSTSNNSRTVSWEYFVSDSESLTVKFVDNLVAGVSG